MERVAFGDGARSAGQDSHTIHLPRIAGTVGLAPEDKLCVCVRGDRLSSLVFNFLTRRSTPRTLFIRVLVLKIRLYWLDPHD